MCDRSECDSDRILSLRGKTSDLCFTDYDGESYEGYVPSGAGVGGGDYIDVSVCLDCGKVQGDFPVGEPDLSSCYPL